MANLHLNGTTYLPVACGPRHNSSPLLATVHAKEKNDASENSCAERSDRTRQAVYAKSDVSTADDPLDASRSRDIVSRMSGSDAGYAENRRSRAGRTHTAKVDAWLKIGLAEIIDRRRSIRSRLVVDLVGSFGFAEFDDRVVSFDPLLLYIEVGHWLRIISCG